jgi:hypothetical protein
MSGVFEVVLAGLLAAKGDQVRDEAGKVSQLQIEMDSADRLGFSTSL